MQSIHNLIRNPGGVTKLWSFSAVDASQGRRERPHKLMLRHNKITGQRFVMLDGVELPGTRGNTNILNAVEISFSIDGAPAVITITPDLSVGGFVYSCRVGNRFLTELADTLEPEDGQGQEALPPVKVVVPEIRTQSSEGKLIVHYKVIATLAGDPAKEVTVFRRFKEFDKLDRLVRSAFADSHLLNSLPPLPGKVWNPFADQTDPAFIEQRRQELEVYLRRLILMPKASTNPDLFRFLSMHPVTGVPLDPSDINQHVELKF